MIRLLLTPLLLACLVGLAAACAPVTFRGEKVAIASESALIVYDEKTKTEHFIRRGTFETRVPYFGFLVPTPSKPEVKEVPDDVFTLLADWTKPKDVTEVVKRKREREPTKSKREDKDAAPKGVEVLGSGHVAGFDYKILKGATAAELKSWLDEHSYVTRPDLEKWLEPYAKKGWILTAFQMKKPEQGKDDRDLNSKAIRMSFQTDKPFYPYLEPEGQREEGSYRPDRLLRVFYAGTQRVEGSLPDAKASWAGQTRWSKPLEEGQQQTLMTKLREKGDALAAPEKVWLTEFEDRSSPRPGGSALFFAPSADQSTTERPPNVHYHYVYEDEEGWGGGASGWGNTAVVISVVLAAGLLGLLGFLTWRSLSRKPA
jgi:hypothetical protein